MALLLTCRDEEERAEVYECTADREQATIVFDVAADMVRVCPALSRRMKILASQMRMEGLESARKELDKTKKKPVSQKMFRAI